MHDTFPGCRVRQSSTSASFAGRKSQRLNKKALPEARTPRALSRYDGHRSSCRPWPPNRHGVQYCVAEQGNGQGKRQSAQSSINPSAL